MTRLIEMPRLLRVFGVTIAGLLVCSCAHDSDRWMTTAVKNQMMLVRVEPPSFGFQRLKLQASHYPDMAVFVSQRGVPDFLAETGNQDRRYFILYYLRKRQAFACRTRSDNNHAVEFAGPYPITDREFRMLDGFRRDPSKSPRGL